MTKAIAAFAAMIGLFIAPIFAADIEVTAAWARATAGAGKNGAAYVSLTNRGADTAIVGAESPVAERVSLHGHQMDGDVMRMRPVDRIDMPSGGDVTMAPGGLHIMLMGLVKPLAEGDHFPLSLELADGQTVTSTVMVGGVGAMGPEEVSDHNSHGGHE